MRKILPGYPNGVRLQGLVIKDGQILVIHRLKIGQEYYVLPGGGWEEGESEEEGVKREVWEETSVEVAVKEWVYELRIKDDSIKKVYWCEYLAGEPQLGDFNELQDMQKNDLNKYLPMWLPLGKIQDVQLYDAPFKTWFLENWKDGQLPGEAKSEELTVEEVLKH